MNRLFIGLMACSLSIAAFASDVEDLAKDGYAVVSETSVKGYSFEGCEHGKVIAFTNGLKFKCSEYNYHYSYNPDVYILENIRYGDYKVVIDDEEFEGRLGR